MTKRDKLHAWLLEQPDWLYLNQIPHEEFGMTKPSLHSALRDLCESGRADYRIAGVRQYRAKQADAPKRGRGSEKLNNWSSHEQRT